MRHIPKFIQTSENQILEIDSYAHGIFQIRNHPTIKSYDIASGNFCSDPHGVHSLGLQAKTPETFKEWEEIYLKKLAKSPLMPSTRFSVSRK